MQRAGCRRADPRGESSPWPERQQDRLQLRAGQDQIGWPARGAALRGSQGAAAGVLVVAVVTNVATAAGDGPFTTDHGSFSGLVNAQVFLAIVAFTTFTLVVLTRDLVRRGEVERRLLHEARHDPLTGLPNRRLVLDRLGHRSAPARGSACAVAALMIDLDRFKEVNDLFGHAAGDAVLVATAQRLREQTRAADVVARLGGDEFNKELYLLAYWNIYSNQGAMMPGASEKLPTACPRTDKIDQIIEAMRRERYRFSPAGRVYIPKKNGKLRPLGLPSWSDKLVEHHLLRLRGVDPEQRGASRGPPLRRSLCYVKMLTLPGPTSTPTMMRTIPHNTCRRKITKMPETTKTTASTHKITAMVHLT